MTQSSENLGTMMTSWTTQADNSTALSINDVEVDSEAEWSWSYKWAWSNIVQLSFAVLGIVGNLLVILALLKQKATKHSTDIFIGALAVSDFLTSIFIIPIPVASAVPNTVLGEAYCKMIFTRYFMWSCIHASAYTLTGMSVERFIAVVFPLHWKLIATRRNVQIYLFIVAIGSVLSCAAFLRCNSVGNVCACTHTLPLLLMLSCIAFLIRVGIPVTLMVLTQFLVIISLHRQSRKSVAAARNVGNDSVPSFHKVARNRVVRLTFIIVMVYILTVSPSQITAVVLTLSGNVLSYYFSPLYYVLTFAVFINSCANPLIYAAQYPKFRLAIRHLFRFRSSSQEASLFSSQI
ncbi:allatostatin-A receptor-like [Diadema setosum]|uniref:allatostatin-A receptor-like n=1 Tax=Diadema setosum TaxID=31175 RepID=UPI003B3A16F8